MLTTRSLLVLLGLSLAGVCQAQWNGGWGVPSSGFQPQSPGYPSSGYAPAGQPSAPNPWAAPQTNYVPQYSGYAPAAPVTNWNNAAVGTYPAQVAAPQVNYYAPPTPNFGTPSAAYPNYAQPNYAPQATPYNAGNAITPRYAPSMTNPAYYYPPVTQPAVTQPIVAGYAPQAPITAYYPQPGYQQPVAVSPVFGSSAAMWRRRYMFP